MKKILLLSLLLGASNTSFPMIKKIGQTIKLFSTELRCLKAYPTKKQEYLEKLKKITSPDDGLNNYKLYNDRFHEILFTLHTTNQIQNNILQETEYNEILSPVITQMIEKLDLEALIKELDCLLTNEKHKETVKAAKQELLTLLQQVITLKNSLSEEGLSPEAEGLTEIIEEIRSEIDKLNLQSRSLEEIAELFKIQNLIEKNYNNCP